MAKKTTKKDAAVRRAERAKETAEAAVADAEALIDLLPKKQRRKVAKAVKDARTVADVSPKKLARHPKRRRRRIEKAVDRLQERTAKARRRLRKNGGTAGSGAAPANAPTAAVLAAAQAEILPTPGLEALTLFALRRRAKEAGITGYSRLTKAELVESLSS